MPSFTYLYRGCYKCTFRRYYKCTFRRIENCQATKHMQRFDVGPAVFEITYGGYHTCQSHQVTNSTLQATSFVSPNNP